MQKAVNSVQELYRRWQDLLNNPNTAGKEEFNWTSNEIKSNVRSVEWDLEDLEETIGIVESNPSKFTLSMNEIENRKAFISNVKRTMQSIKDDINSADTKAKVEKSNRQVGALHCNSKQSREIVTVLWIAVVKRLLKTIEIARPHPDHALFILLNKEG